jgi:lipid-A-disaccharide synthase
VDRMLVIFPFEERFYRERGVKAEFVGHPLADLPPPAISRSEFAERSSLDPACTWIALLPGSRAKEIRANLPEMLAGARMLAARKGTGFSPHDELLGRAGALAPEAFEFVIPLAPTLAPEHRRMVACLVEQHAPDLPVRLVEDPRAALFHARAAVVASGTATVEAALIGNPFVVVYRVSPLTYAIAKRVVTVPHVAMANLIAGKRVVPELIQNEFTAANIVDHLKPLLPDGPPRQSMKQELEQIRSLLKTENEVGEPRAAIDRAAAITLELLGIASSVVDPVRF